MPTPIYHITHIDNLDRILTRGALVCNAAGPNYVNIANAGIQGRRAAKVVPCGPGGVLHEYVPFYFGPRSPMLYAIHCNAVDGYAGGQDRIMHLVASVKGVIDSGQRFVFTDGHAAMEMSTFYTNWNMHRAEIDWALMTATYWNDTQEYPDRKRRRQAEFLVHRRVPIELVYEIGVRTQAHATAVQRILLAHESRIRVVARPGWYY
jgi:hypothetical protein